MAIQDTIVFDIDDTICSNIRRTGYENCKPNKRIISKINNLHDKDGFKIILYTSRGMLSCNGDINKILVKNKSVLEKWLKDNGVKYDELIFGKPLADVYVDDKCMTPDDFLEHSFCELKAGGSKKKIYKLGKYVKKEETKGYIERFKDWYEDNNVLYKPDVISYLDDAIYMKYIYNQSMADVFNSSYLRRLINIIFIEATYQPKNVEFNIDNHKKILLKNVANGLNDYEVEHNYNITICKRFLEKNEEIFKKYASICHGDMILSNILVKNGIDLYFIDPQYFRKESSYLLDFAKLRMSINDYELKFGISSKSNKKYLLILDDVLKMNKIYNLVIGLNLMYIIRLYRYKDDKQKVVKMERELIEENEDVFEGL